ncbi:MAG: DUF853 family protein, partial [Lachnospiraceae bacterium]|nr:DUF853 family protein [Lachnospiraceae bacterium]
AHLLFEDAPKALLQKIEQVVKLIRSKGVGIYFITQNPSDIPNDVLAQLGNKVQHALHAYTPAEKKKVKAAAESFRENPEFDTMEAISSLGIGEALVSFLDRDGRPSVVERAKILPPKSQMGPIDEMIRNRQIQQNNLYIKYEAVEDRDSAYELLTKRIAAEDAAEKQAKEDALLAKEEEKQRKLEEKELERQRAAAEREAERKAKKTKTAVKSVAKTATGTIGREIGNTIGSSVGGKFGKKLGGNLGAALGRGLLDTLFRF